MLVFGTSRETLPLRIECDPSSGLPLSSEQDGLLQLILAYLALPYSVTEYGCGKKASLIIDQLLALGVAPYALSRVLILERDMSPAALAEPDAEARENALLADNFLFHLADPDDDRLCRMLEDSQADFSVNHDGSLQTGPFTVRPAARRVQFETTRSHVSAQIAFWDEKRGRVIKRLLDPSLARDRLFPVDELRGLLRAPEALIFSAPLLGHFRLQQSQLTSAQAQALEGTDPLEAMGPAEEAAALRALTGAPEGSIGDPETWTYANNLRTEDDAAASDRDHFQRQRLLTGRGDELAGAAARLFEAREQQRGDSSEILAELTRIERASELRRQARADAEWSGARLQPLADLATQLAAYRSLECLARFLRDDGELLESLEDDSRLQALRGLGVRLRRRIERLAGISRRDDERIDARALTEGFMRATRDTIQQMNRAGLTVFIDRVGNVHGLLADPETAAALRRSDAAVADFCAESVWHGSHIDTVNDAGKFDGRLGVLAGIETVQLLTDLDRYFDLPWRSASGGVHTHVSAFIGEEMTFTGNGVSMPGSAAICARARVQDVHGMRNAAGECFGDLLRKMLSLLREEQRAGTIDLVNDLTGVDDQHPLSACSDPTLFYSRHSYERHIEQGPLLDRAAVPSVIVDTIMGIHQEDFFFRGARAEEAALAFDQRLRRLTDQEHLAGVRITVGMLQPEDGDEGELRESVQPAARWTLSGELNHAGATPTADRRDPGVAAGRLAAEFRRWCREAVEPGLAASLRPSVSNVRLTPGSDRNVIPGEAALTLALEMDASQCQEADRVRLGEDLLGSLKAFAVGRLARSVAEGGEGVSLVRVDPIDYTRLYRSCRASIDLRADRSATMTAFREAIDAILAELATQFEVTVETDLQQQLPPSSLEHSGQVLLMERSYGGSHNPRETELLSDIARGSVLQFAATRAALQLPSLEDINLFRFVEKRLPDSWLARMDRFTSGALHDTCNIAATARERLRDAA